MDARKGLIFSTCTVLLMLLLLKKTRLGHSLAAAWNKAVPDPVQNAWIERDEEEAAYQNAVRWEDVKTER